MQTRSVGPWPRTKRSMTSVDPVLWDRSEYRDVGLLGIEGDCDD